MERDSQFSTPALELIVQSGRAAGAKAALPYGRSVSIGNDVENDIVLFSLGAPDWSMDLQARGANAVAVLLEGAVQLNGKPMTAGKEHVIEPQSKIVVGDAEFVIVNHRLEALVDADTNRSSRSETDISAPDPLSRFRRQSGRVDSIGPMPDKEYAGGSAARRSSKERARSILLPLLFLLGGFGLLYFGVTSQSGMGDGDADGSSELINTTFKERFDMAGYESLNYMPDQEDGRTVVQGQVDTRADKSKLVRMAMESNADVDFDIQVDEAFRESITDVYRVNGVAADVKVKGRGEAAIATETADLERLKRIEMMLKNDLDHLTVLDVSNVVPAVVKLPDTKLDPDKEIALIVAGEGGYIVTRDSSRYFVGSLMPNGYKVKTIVDGSAVVVRDGEEVTLKF